MSTTNPEKPAFSLGEIGQIAMTVDDLERATAFYRDRLGVKFLFAAPPSLAFFDCSGIRLMLTLPEQGEKNSAVLYFKVDDIDSAFTTLKERGVVFVDTPHLVHKAPGWELWMVFLRDSENNLLALMHEKHE
jgi:predicted enzyme related to lactoylglutathione lyase